MFVIYLSELTGYSKSKTVFALREEDDQEESF